MNGSSPNQNVSLGCGTLILIAVIVSIFAGKPDLGPVQSNLSDLETEGRRLEQKLDELNRKLEQKEAELRRLEKKLDGISQKLDQKQKP